MAHRINVVVQDDIWRLLQRIPQGDRSRTINEEIGRSIREDREGGH